MTHHLDITAPGNMLTVGALYRITRKGDVRPLPNLYRFEGTRALHCQLHGEHYGTAWCFRKRRNSDVRQWGTVACFDSDDVTVELVE